MRRLLNLGLFLPPTRPRGTLLLPPLKHANFFHYWYERPLDFPTPHPRDFSQYDLKRAPMANLAQLSHTTSYLRWGFPIFRTTYTEKDDELFTSYLSDLYRYSHESLGIHGRLETLGPCLYYPVIEHPSLDGLSRKEIRERFSEWVADTTDERDGAGAVKVREKKAPHYESCLMVDEECLESFRETRGKSSPGDGKYDNGQTKVIVVERDWWPEKYRGWHNGDWTDGEIHEEWDKEHEEETGEVPEREFPRTTFEEIDEFRGPLVGWMYADIQNICGLYDKLMTKSARNHWYQNYVRPPGVYDGNSGYQEAWESE